jgi:hypothetical protein
MSLPLYEASVSVLVRGLRNLSVILDKAVAHARAAQIDPASLVAARLAPDMLTLAQQVQVATDTAKGCGARLAGVPVPSYPDTESTFEELQARIAKTVAFLETLPRDAIDGAADRPIELSVGRQPMRFVGRDYLLTFALPNFYFHVTTAYGILRHRGVPLGKPDFIGPI